jgi:pSer/pThr/pTyr-binding forkhead associated (FHA) protein
MLVLELGGKRYPVAAGEMIVGSDDEALLPLTGEGVAPRHAVVQGWADGSAAVRAVSGAEVLVNGVRLGPEPTPLLHGDKLHIAGQEILVVDQKRAGSTQVMSAIELPDGPSASEGAPARLMTGGRIVSLTDGREYKVGVRPLVFGREASADVVVAGSEISRRHAEVQLRGDGYWLADMSANGSYVNGERVRGERRLGRGDMIRMGDEEFRFHADPDTDTHPLPPPPGAEQQLRDTLFGLPAFQPEAAGLKPPAPSVSLASLLLRSGPLKGERMQVRVPVANVGRADYNDIVVSDPSVSTMHAKLQSRGGVWMLSDLGSTNGTFVDGELVRGEVPLSPGATIRFGEVSALFEPVDESVGSGLERTRVMSGIDAPVPAPPAENGMPPAAEVPRPPRPARSRRPEPPAPSRGPVFVLVALVVVAIALAAFLMLKR